jgi:hypothetical protein
VKPRVSDAELAAFEQAVRACLAAGDDGSIEVLGYGEVTTVLALDAGAGRFALKRLPEFPDMGSAERAVRVIRLYLEALRKLGVDVVDTDVRYVHLEGDPVMVYCVQPALPSECLGPAYMHALDESAAVAAFDRILEILARAVTDVVAPDGQLSNWAFVEDRILYMDVSSPFMRDAEGRQLLDWDHYLQSSMPLPLQPIVRRWVLPHLLDKYFTLRGQVVDLLGNLIKEGLVHLEVPLRERANQKLAFAPPISEEEVRKYYAGDARTYAFLQAARRADRWVQQSLGRRYGTFLPPKLDRNV